MYFPSDVNRGDGVRLSVAPQNAADKLGLGRQRLVILQHLNAECRLAETTRAAYDAHEALFNSEILTHD